MKVYFHRDLQEDAPWEVLKNVNFELFATFCDIKIHIAWPDSYLYLTPCCHMHPPLVYHLSVYPHAHHGALTQPNSQALAPPTTTTRLILTQHTAKEIPCNKKIVLLS